MSVDVAHTVVAHTVIVVAGVVTHLLPLTHTFVFVAPIITVVVVVVIVVGGVVVVILVLLPL